jgi:hypothetical protein
VRRIKLGRRDLFKLDVIEARLRDGGSATTGKEAMADLSDVAARTIARYSETLAPRTLLFVFGDHGFRAHHRGSAAAKAEAGRQSSERSNRWSASPEEVIVPAFAFLVGEVH